MSLPGSGQPDEIFGFLDLDTDQSAATGILPWVDFFCPQPSGLGTDYYVDFFGSVTVVDSTFANLGPVPAMATGNTLTVQVPLALLGGDDGIVNTATVLGDSFGPNDCAPDGTFLTSDMVVTAPTLGSAALLALALLLLASGLLAARRLRSGVRHQ